MANITNPTVANGVAFGQYGSAYSNTHTNTITPPTGLVIVAVTFLEDYELDKLTPADSGKTSFNHDDTASGSGGEVVADGTVFPKGLTVYGRWKEVSLNDNGTAAGIICYFAP